eukprot:CAMPEP_0202443324 /NCGR_PEP_ID=MMETSP1360-20130828/2635_1 /ASSEMBLY_ACC=CAM_ASM_000848 /TAXON_ID=515479 /ORGANISM="Licmophora paradoxa, Strain CCMP2313" /LENGTH=119 /DNA_ID=CAMNT_0049058993 /DNA_START=45 /DNA_END=404 /DNA_ORIENTATION=+
MTSSFPTTVTSETTSTSPLSSSPSSPPPSSSSLLHVAGNSGVRRNRHRSSSLSSPSSSSPPPSYSPLVLAMLNGNRLHNCGDVIEIYQECLASDSTDRICSTAAGYFGSCVGEDGVGPY